MRHPSWRGVRNDRNPAEARHGFPAVPPPARATVKGAMISPDHAWRVEVVERDGVESLRVAHGDNVVEGLSLPEATELLRRRGVDMRQLREIDPAA
jgi:bifunctional non-homologous end joining protein LigD